jgi:hypothetical protein
MIAVDVSELIEAALADRQACRLAGIPEVNANSEVAAHLLALANRLRDRIGARAAMRVAFLFWDTLAAEPGETVQ